mgnify:FL=1
MVKYSTEAVTSALGTFPPHDGRPTQGSLWRLKRHIINGLQKLRHPDHPTEGWAGYMRSVAKHRLVSTIKFRPSTPQGDYFQIPPTAITDTEQRVAKSKWKALKDIEDNYNNIQTALVQLFEHVIDEAYHTGATGMGQCRYGNLTPPQIQDQLMLLYGKSSLPELENSLRQLLQPMDRNKPIEVMLREVEAVQIFLLSNPEEEHQMLDVTMISYALIKMYNTGLYGKPIERWNERTAEDRKSWAVFWPAMVAEYERMLREGGGSTVGQEGYGTAFMATAQENNEGDDISLVESVIQYAERTSEAEAKMSAMESRLSQLEMGPPPETAYFTPQQPTFVHNPKPPAQVNIPPPAQQQTWKKRKTPRAQPGPSDQMNWQTPAPTPPQQTSPWPQQYTQPPPQHQYVQQNMGGRRRGGMYSNKLKRHNNLFYCFSCGYDVDHPGNHCPNPKPHHDPHTRRDNAHLVPLASMVAQHKTLPDGTGAGLGWNIAQSVDKAQYTMRDMKQYRHNTRSVPGG